ncbi:MAG TPA: glycoside hydrolase family 36 protein [Rectinemataceae bacterium]|nr:glycoside hydrolase family 36 protein [Rectinemataceae bacterium]
MRVDGRISVEIAKVVARPGFEFVVRAREPFIAGELLLSLFYLDFEELSRLLDMDEEWSRAFADRSARYIFSNGWQSWSFGGELRGAERIKPALLIEALNTYVLRPGPRETRGQVLSHFFTRIRAGRRRIVLVSTGPDRDRAGAPLAFRIDRRSLGIGVEAYAGGGSYAAGQVLARVACARLEGFFAERDFYASIFGGEGRFERLAFLGGGARLMPGGYESWYNHYTAIDEGVIRSDLEALSSNDNLINSYYIRRGRPTVFQIDDGWEAAIGDWVPHPAKFPAGMAGLARAIESRGLVPGLWLAPFIVERGSRAAAEHGDWLLRDPRGRPLVAGWNDNWSGDFFAWDLSIPEVGDWLESIFKTVVDGWGYRYLKLDFLYAGLLEGKRKKGGAAWEHYERIMTRIVSRQTDAKGRHLAWLGCGAPLESSWRHFPLMRIGADTRESWEHFQARLIRHQGRPSAKVNLLHTIGRSVLDGAVFINDPDVVFCREEGMSYGDREKELIAAAARMFASQIMFSDDAAVFGDPGERAFTKRIIELYDRLEGLEFGATRIGRGLFAIEERGGRLHGWINLGDRRTRVADSSAGGATGIAVQARDPVIPFHAQPAPGGWLLEPRSMTLLGATSSR